MFLKIPQMSPLSWLFLYIFMILMIFLFMVILNYFKISFKKDVKLSKLNLVNYNWCW